jgi:photosystem I subunit 2
MTDALDLQTPSPTFGGSTGGWLRSSETEEKYVITWTSKKEQVFEMPTSGAAIMKSGKIFFTFQKKSSVLHLVHNFVLSLKLTIIKSTVFFQIVKFSIYTLKMEFTQKKLM